MFDRYIFLRLTSVVSCGFFCVRAFLEMGKHS